DGTLAPTKGGLAFRVVDGVQILGAGIVGDTCQSCGFIGELIERGYVIRFDEIPPSHGAVMQVAHTSTQPFSDTRFEVTLRHGVRSINVWTLSSRFTNLLGIIGILVAGLSFVVLAINGIANTFSDWSIPYTKSYVGAVFVAGAALALLSYLLEKFRNNLN